MISKSKKYISILNSYINKLSLILILIIAFSNFSVSQSLGEVSGKVNDNEGKPLSFVNVFEKNNPGNGVATDEKGVYKLKVSSNKNITIVFSSLGFEKQEIKLRLKSYETRSLDLKLVVVKNTLEAVNVIEERDRASGLQPVNPKSVESIPSLGGIEFAMKSIFIAVSSSGDEMSSQYSVRGGSFDENLVYVNGIEIYRPFLIRSGQQEGLSFVNQDLVSSLKFSAGGFEAKYGDKMSSVLDITYKKPKEFGASASASLLGATAHVQGISKNRNFTHISGIRYKTNQYMLGSLDTKGEYNPSFLDFQTYLTYDISDKLELTFLGNIAQNTYLFTPESRETTFGNVNEALNLKIYFDGKEADMFTTYFGAFSANYLPKKKVKLSLTVSAFKTQEQETFDIQGQYYLNELDRQIGSDNMGDSIMNLGVGTFLNHARTYLDASVLNVAHRGTATKLIGETNNILSWGVKNQIEIINNTINEWKMLDSAGYSLPFSDKDVNLKYLDTGSFNNLSNRAMAYVQNRLFFMLDSSIITVVLGVRGNYWSFNNQLVISPRASASLKPNWEKDFLFRIAAGVYNQPPFYKEIRKLSGEINTNIKAQNSYHIVLGSDYNFKAWNRPFKFVAEVYYKYLTNLIPYDIDNVRIRYYGDNLAHGYAVGLDMKINGEFVKNAESWANISIMQTREDIDGDNRGYMPRPSDQIVNFGIFFQDYVPKNPSYKVHLNVLFGTGLPFGAPNNPQLRAVVKMPPYRRIDIGFSKQLKEENTQLGEHNPFRRFKSIWLTAEVFNLLDIDNTISHYWVTDIRNRQYAVPNYLTSRRLNLKLIIKI